jgi:asparagine synthase (glutamine-hydrolysing)
VCGIGGYLLKSKTSIDSQRLSQAMSELRHRGPDDSGLYQDSTNGVGLIHTRLSIIDLTQAGHQPMISEDGRVVLVFNGEVYNFNSLRLELEADGYKFRGNSDTEVLLNLYLANRHSKESLKNAFRRLNGIFSFGIWDDDANSLLLVRDALGVKPLYFIDLPQCFAFASEIKALKHILVACGVPSAGDLDEVSINRYLTFLWCPGNGTPFKNVRKILPGEAIWVRKNVILDRMTWYELPVLTKNNLHIDRPKMSRATAISQTEFYLRQAVSRQVQADVPIGAFLSGGLDSSSIVTFARELVPDIKCFSIEIVGDVDNGAPDDLPYAKEVAAHLGVSLDLVRVDSRNMANDLSALVYQLDEPLADPATLNVMYISKLAREQGIKVLLSGSGGDDLFTGYRRHCALTAEPFWSWLPVSVRKSIEKSSIFFDQRTVLGRRFSKLVTGLSLNGDERLVNYFIWNKRKDLEALYTPAFQAALGNSKAIDPMMNYLRRFSEDIKPLERMLALEQRFFLPDHNLIYTDKMSMAAGVEVRVPFLDLDLVEHAYQVPIKYKQNWCTGKWVLKKAMEPYLPKSVIYRKKTGFGLPLRRWTQLELRPLISEVLSEKNIRKRGIFDPYSVDKLLIANDMGKLDASYTIFSLLCVELWCQRFIDEDIKSI